MNEINDTARRLILMGAAGIGVLLFAQKGWWKSGQQARALRKADMEAFKQAYPDGPATEVWLKARSTLREELRPKLDALARAQVMAKRDAPKTAAMAAEAISQTQGWPAMHCALAAFWACVRYDNGFSENLFADRPGESPLPTREALRALFPQPFSQPEPERRLTQEPQTRECSFCGKRKGDAEIIVGPSVGICDECVNLCGDILTERGERRGTKTP